MAHCVFLYIAFYEMMSPPSWFISGRNYGFDVIAGAHKSVERGNGEFRCAEEYYFKIFLVYCHL